MTDIFAEYAQVKAQLAELEQRRLELEEQVLDELDNHGGKCTTNQGAFSSYGRKVYAYSSTVTALKENLAGRKKFEEKNGIAELQKVRNVLTFTPIKHHG